MITDNQKKIIHILLKEYNIDEQVYRDDLFKRYEVFSCVDLTFEQADNFIHDLKMQNSLDYKAGFERALRVYKIDNLKILEQKIREKYNRELTEFEKEMFSNFNFVAQKEFIENL